MTGLDRRSVLRSRPYYRDKGYVGTDQDPTNVGTDQGYVGTGTNCWRGSRGAHDDGSRQRQASRKERVGPSGRIRGMMSLQLDLNKEKMERFRDSG